MSVEIMKFKDEEKVVVTSLDVARTFGKNHYDVLRDINNISETLNDTTQFCGLFFKDKYKASNGKTNSMYYMNRDGFTLLVMGYTGDKAMRFKLAYIKQFNAMEKALQGKINERIKGTAVRNLLTDAIKESRENERMHGHAYSTYTNVIYKSLFDKTAAQLRKDLNVPNKDNLRDYFNADQLKAIQESEALVSGLMGRGLGYQEVKTILDALPVPNVCIPDDDSDTSVIEYLMLEKQYPLTKMQDNDQDIIAKMQDND